MLAPVDTTIEEAPFKDCIKFISSILNRYFLELGLYIIHYRLDIYVLDLIARPTSKLKCIKGILKLHCLGNAAFESTLISIMLLQLVLQARVCFVRPGHTSTAERCNTTRNNICRDLCF